MVHQGSTLSWSLKILQRYDEATIKKHYFSGTKADDSSSSFPPLKFKDVVESYNTATKLLCKKTTISDDDWESAAKQTAFQSGSQLKSFWKKMINNDPPSDFEDSDEEE